MRNRFIIATQACEGASQIQASIKVTGINVNRLLKFNYGFDEAILCGKDTPEIVVCFVVCRINTY